MSLEYLICSMINLRMLHACFLLFDAKLFPISNVVHIALWLLRIHKIILVTKLFLFVDQDDQTKKQSDNSNLKGRVLEVIKHIMIVLRV